MPYCVVVLDGRQPICVLRLVWRNSHSEHFSIFLWEFSMIVPPKNGKKRYIPMAPSVAKLFALQWQRQECLRKGQGLSWQNCGMVFTNPTGGYLSSRTVYDCFKRLAKKIGAPNARVHDLRHTYAMACIESGVDIKTLQENLGHATAAFTLEVYGHVSRQMQINSANKLESFIQNVYAQPGLPSAVSF